jgi:hypothetical protein
MAAKKLAGPPWSPPETAPRLVSDAAHGLQGSVYVAAARQAHYFLLILSLRPVHPPTPADRRSGPSSLRCSLTCCNLCCCAYCCACCCGMAAAMASTLSLSATSPDTPATAFSIACNTAKALGLP